jgi:hypothetical protein
MPPRKDENCIPDSPGKATDTHSSYLTYIAFSRQQQFAKAPHSYVIRRSPGFLNHCPGIYFEYLRKITNTRSDQRAFRAEFEKGR